MVAGHRETWKILDKKVDNNKKWLWFHAASLGEFEQGRPIIERLKKEYPHYSVIVSFYSPSGYEVRKNYDKADIVCYLPFDNKRNVKRFIKKVNPHMAFFIKYEFWPNYLNELKKSGIPTYLISGIFRANQAFFKSWGFSYKNILRNFTGFFVQDYTSVKLLNSVGITENITISGDTRFDRVIEIFENSKRIEIAGQFREKHSGKILVCGSSWPKDENIFIPFFNENKQLKLIIAPHEIHEDHLLSIESKLKRPFIRYTKANIDNISEFDCLIMDCFGLLSSVYRYGDIAYIGGGFGVGIHNTLEAAVYGIPIIFGPNFSKFIEAAKLIEKEGGFSISNEFDFVDLMTKFLSDEELLKVAGKNAGEMVKQGSGGTDKIISSIKF